MIGIDQLRWKSAQPASLNLIVRCQVIMQLGVLLATATMLVGCERAPRESITERANADHVTMVTAEDPAMLRAFARSRKTLDSFLHRLESGDPIIKDPSVKVKIEDNGAVEYFWITDFSATATGFSGSINNDPEAVHSVKLGQVITFPRSQIYDWTYIDI
jgi:uncharacterized protein YegJ (DUF2314 family)